MKHTKTACLQMIPKAYLEATGKATFRMDELAAWAMMHGLYPPPKRGDAVSEFEAWKLRLDLAREGGSDGLDQS